MKNKINLSITCGLTFKSIFFIKEIVSKGIYPKNIFVQTNSFKIKREIKKIKSFNLINYLRFLDKYIFLYIFKFHQTPLEFCVSRLKWYLKKKKILKEDILNVDIKKYDGDIFFRKKIMKEIFKKLNITTKIYLISDINLLKKKNPILKEEFDFLIVMGGGILSPKIFNKAKIASIVLHNTFLPKLRGWGGGEIWSLINNDISSLGYSIIHAHENFDQGDIIVQKNLTIKKNDDLNSLIKRNLDLGINLFISTVEKFEKNNVEVKKQDHNKATYIYRSPTKEEFTKGLENLEIWKKNYENPLSQK